MCGRLGGRAAHTLITRSGIRSSAPPQCTCGNALGQHDEPKKLPLIHPSMCACVCVCVCVCDLNIFLKKARIMPCSVKCFECSLRPEKAL